MRPYLLQKVHRRVHQQVSIFMRESKISDSVTHVFGTLLMRLMYLSFSLCSGGHVHVFYANGRGNKLCSYSYAHIHTVVVGLKFLAHSAERSFFPLHDRHLLVLNFASVCMHTLTPAHTQSHAQPVTAAGFTDPKAVQAVRARMVLAMTTTMMIMLMRCR